MEINISVVVPTYKRIDLLKNCLQSLLHQDFHENSYEVIVVSDGPDEQTEHAIEALKINSNKNIKFLSLPFKKGPAAARNLGWKNAKGTLIAFTDDDCLPEKNWLKQIWKHYKNEQKIAFTGKMIVPVSACPTDFELNTKGLETGEFVTANCICTKETLLAVDGFDEAFTSAWREDSDLHFKLLKAGIPIVKLNDAIVVHPVRKAPWGVSIKEQKKSMFNALLYKKYPVLYRQRIRSAPSWNYYFILLFFLLLLLSIILKVKWLGLIALGGWAVLTAAFINKRLVATNKAPSHVFEMISTSIIIPFLSVFWTLYGSIKYRVLFL